MGKFHFQDDSDSYDDNDDDDDDTYYDIPQKKGRWEQDHFQRSHFYGDEDSSTPEREEGEIIEEESETEDGSSRVDWKNNSNEGGRRAFRSYFPSFSAARTRSNSNSRSPSLDRSFDEKASPRNWDETDNDDVWENNNKNENLDGAAEYRLIASSKYDRNYERDDFYPSGIQGNNTRADINNSNSRTNPVSGDENDDFDHETPYNNYSASYQNSNGGSSGSRRASDGGLVRSSNHKLSNGAPEVHYHIYISEKQASRWFSQNQDEGPPTISDQESPQNDNRSKRNTALWKRITLWAMVTHLFVFVVRRYNLIVLSPPPSYLTWEEYVGYQSRLIRRVSREGYSLLKHLSSATTQIITNRNSLSNDDEDASVPSPRYDFPEVWASFAPSKSQMTESFPAGSNDENTGHNHRGTVLFGHDAALNHLQSGLNIWSSSQRIQRKARHSKNHPKKLSSSESQKKRPLIVYACGGIGVGRESLAYLLLEQLVLHDSFAGATASALDECAAAAAAKASLTNELTVSERSDESQNREYHCPLLHLTSSDLDRGFRPRRYRGDGDDDDDDILDDLTLDTSESGGHFDRGSILSIFYQTILDHVLAAGEGASIVLLDKIDAVTTCDHEADVCNSDNSLPTSWLRDLMIEVLSHEEIFGNTIFVLTSQTGKDTVEKWTRKRLNFLQGAGISELVSAAANIDVEALLRYELQRYHAPTTGVEEDGARDSSMGVKNWLLVPMAPLNKNSMEAILERLASRGPNPTFLDDGSIQTKYFEEPWRNRRMIITESASERLLDALEWHQWIYKSSGEVLRIWSPDGASPLIDLWEDHVLKTIEGLSDCPSIHHDETERNILILDYEGISTDRLRLRSCEQSEDDSVDATTSTDGRRWVCSETISCSFFI